MTTYTPAKLAKAVSLVAMALTIALAPGCGGGDGGSGDGSGAVAQGPLSTAELDGLTFTREEEKLARDTYAALGAVDPVFATIGASEQTHMDAVATLLTRYDVADPAAGKAAGQFVSPVLQPLYDALVAKGRGDAVSAFAVGVEIEELDIRDIERLKQSSNHADLDRVFDNLTRGSRNHLRTFHAKLVAAGGSYTPKYLDAATFQGIVGSPMETGP